MREHVRALGAIIGTAGAQTTTFVLFAMLAEPCDCTGGIGCGAGQECLWGWTLWEYWARYGLVGTVCFAVLGYLIGSTVEDE